MRQSKRKLLLLGIAGLIAIALWMLLGRRIANTDEAHRRNLQRYSALYFRLRDVEYQLGRDVAKFVGVQALERRYSDKADAEREGLVASGYFVKLSAAVTNLNGRIKEIDDRFSNLGTDDEGLGLIAFDRQSNVISVICRPHDAPAYREALLKP
jgi:hypothetical protein